MVDRLQSKVLAEPVFVGRERELAQLEHHLMLAVEGDGTTVFVSGEAGAGKTRLINEFLKRAKRRGVTMLFGWCLSEATVPYFPFIEAFDAYFASSGEDVQPISPPQLVQLSHGEVSQVEEHGITALLTRSRPFEKLGKPETFSSQLWKDQTFAAVARMLHSISAREPIILFIDDVQWADSASLALLHYVARVVNNSERVLVIATHRSEELTTDAEGRPHPLAETLRMMRREDLFTEIKLSHLNETSVSKMAENMIGGSLQEEFAEKLAKESRGNALFVVESLRMLVERKGLVQENNRWRLAVDELGIPSKVKDIILRRLAVLKYAQRRVLDAASVIGEKFDLELLSTLLGLDSLEVLETLNIIANSTSLVCAEGNFYSFNHARSRETLYEELSLPLKRGYHARIAEKLESAKSAVLPFGDLAYHYAQAGNKEKAIKYSLEAGKDALEKYSSSQAISHFTYVLQALGEDPQYAEQRNMALEGLGDAFYASNKFKEAVKTFETLADTDVGAVKMRALTKAMFAAFFQGDFLCIIKLVRRAEEYGDMSRLDRAHIFHFKTLNPNIGSQLEGINLIEEALRIFEEEYSLSDAAWLLFLAAGGPARRGEMKEALAMGLRSIAIYGDLGDFRSQMEPLNQVAGGTFSSFGLYPEALAMLEKVFEIEHKTKMGNYIMLAESCMFSARIVGLMGDFTGAVAKGLKALEYLEKAGSQLWSIPIYYDLVMNYVKLGDMSHAEEYFDKVMEMQPAVNNPFHAFYSNLAKAVYYAGKNQWEQSTKYFNKTGASPVAHFVYAAAKFSFQDNCAWALEKQGKIEEAKKTREDLNKAVKENAEKVKHASVQLGLMAPINVTAGQTFEARLDIVNVSRANCTITNIQNLIPPELKVIAIPTNCTTHQDVLELKDKTLGPFSVKTVTIGLQAPKAGTFNLNPQVEYVDDLGQTKTSTTKAIAITAKPEQPTFEALPGRITTGYTGLDELLLGGIPEEYAVALSAPSCDEKDLLVNRFLKAGVEAGETTFYVTAEAGEGKALAEEHPSNFFLFVCNPRADAMVQDLLNVFKLRGVESLSEIDIALTRAFRALKPSTSGSKRICVDLISDVLLQHHALTTRKWLSALLPSLKSKGFTFLAVINPSMHSPEEVQAILGLFEGEIRIIERETAKGTEKLLRIKRLGNQKYLENELTLTRKKLE
jgi:KaiC/GvpD/RAD55 family RecA-like ATPase/tetratricopeptide (TPR) repeat protein